jgi:hypothetical protein
MVGATGLFAATNSVSVGPSGGQGTLFCSDSRSDGKSAACHGANATSYGTAISSYYSPGFTAYTYNWLGSIQGTVTTTGAIGVLVKSSIDFTSEFSGFTGSYVTVTHNCVSSDCQDVDVYNGTTKIATISGGDSVNVFPSSGTLALKLFASQITLAPDSSHTGDYFGGIDISVVPH